MHQRGKKNSRVLNVNFKHKYKLLMHFILEK